MWCDLIRRPFRTRARLLRDSDQEFTIRWYFAAEGAQQLPWPSPIHVLHRNDQEWIKTSVGDLLYADTTLEKTNVVNPLPAGDHYHGTEEDFRVGGLYLPDLPPFERDDDGIPTVCRPPRTALVIGGVGLQPHFWPGVVSGGFSQQSQGPIAPPAGHVVVGDLRWFPWVAGFGTTAGRLLFVDGLIPGHSYQLRVAEEGDGYGDLHLLTYAGGPFPAYDDALSGSNPWSLDWTVPSDAIASRLSLIWQYPATSHDAGPIQVWLRDVT